MPIESYYVSALHEQQREAEAQTLKLSAEQIQRRLQLRTAVRALNWKDSDEAFRAIHASLEEWEAAHPEDPLLTELKHLIKSAEQGADIYRRCRVR